MFGRYNEWILKGWGTDTEHWNKNHMQVFKQSRNKVMLALLYITNLQKVFRGLIGRVFDLGVKGS